MRFVCGEALRKAQYVVSAPWCKENLLKGLQFLVEYATINYRIVRSSICEKEISRIQIAFGTKFDKRKSI